MRHLYHLNVKRDPAHRVPEVRCHAPYRHDWLLGLVRIPRMNWPTPYLKGHARERLFSKIRKGFDAISPMEKMAIKRLKDRTGGSNTWAYQT